MHKFFKGLPAIGLIASLGACSTVMEAHRPDPVDLHQFSVGEHRLNVLSRIGPPIATDVDGGETCEMYKLVTHGVGRLGKGAIIFGEAAADVYTLGLFEVIATPAEGATASAPHTVMFCYLPDATLDYITDSGPNGVVTVVGDSTRHGAPQAIAATNVTPQATNSSAPLAPPTITANTPASPAPSAAPPSPAAPALSSPAPAAAAPARGPAAKAALLTPAQASSYKLQPGDRLLISTLNEPQNTGTFTVNDKGTIAMEYIGDVPAGGHTASELQSEITKKLGYGFEANPQVSVAVVAPDPARLVSN